jgi:hypothetical protein
MEIDRRGGPDPQMINATADYRNHAEQTSPVKRKLARLLQKLIAVR